MAQLNFNAENVAETPAFEPLPSGNYEAIITDSVMKPTKAGTGAYLELTLEVISGRFNGRQIWSRLNLSNPNPKAVEIAHQELASICRSVGKIQISDSSELHNLPMNIYVKTREENGRYVSEVKAYNAIKKQAPAAPAPQPIQGYNPWVK